MSTKSYTMIRHEMKKSATGIDGRKFFSDSLKKDIITFKEKHGYTTEEVANILGMHPRTVGSMIFNYNNKQAEIARIKVQAKVNTMNFKQLDLLLKKIADQS